MKLRAVGGPAELDWRERRRGAPRDEDAGRGRGARRAAARGRQRRADRVPPERRRERAHGAPPFRRACSARCSCCRPRTSSRASSRRTRAPCPGVVDVGRFPHGEDPLAPSVAAALRAAGFASEARADIQRWQYAKLLTNLAERGAGRVRRGRRARGSRARAPRRGDGVPARRRHRWVPDDEFRARHRAHVTPREIGGRARARRLVVAEPRARERLDRGRLPERRDRAARAPARRPGAAERRAPDARRGARPRAPPAGQRHSRRAGAPARDRAAGAAS